MHNREFKFGYQHFFLCQKSFLKVSSKWLLKNKSDNGKLLLGKTYSGERFRAILALLFFFQGEGVAFRGRCMVELKTIGGELPDIPVEDIAPEEVLKVQVSCIKNWTIPKHSTVYFSLISLPNDKILT